ncbi:hypothetical protein OFN45_33445, partial [Escherichia coli]|nr:hypothetical protein [Escherichia coli]
TVCARMLTGTFHEAFHDALRHLWRDFDRRRFRRGVDDVCASSSLRHALPTASPSRPGSFRRLTPSLAGAYLPV